MRKHERLLLSKTQPLLYQLKSFSFAAIVVPPFVYDHYSLRSKDVLFVLPSVFNNNNAELVIGSKILLSVTLIINERLPEPLSIFKVFLPIIKVPTGQVNSPF
jgi:hypothetical protein